MPTSTKKSATSTRQVKKTAHKKRFDIKNINPVRRLRALRARRAHKSFALTRKRDIPKRAKLPGYIAFTVGVAQTIWEFRQVFLVLLLLYVVASLLLIGYSQQDQYRSLTDALGDVVKEAGENGIDAVTQIGGLFGATLLGSLNSDFTQIQQFYLIGLYVVMWLVVVWLLRHLLAGNKVRVRDGLYNAGAPLIPSMCIVALMLLQALPGALGVLVFTITSQNSVVSSGVAAMCFGVLAALLVILSLYWISSSFLALLIVTLPGTYPMKAVRGASEIALGRRMQLLFRLLWLILLLLLIWVVVLVPALLIDFWIKVSWLPLVTLAIQVATGTSLIFGAAYVFLLYRRMIDDPTE